MLFIQHCLLASSPTVTILEQPLLHLGSGVDTYFEILFRIVCHFEILSSRHVTRVKLGALASVCVCERGWGGVGWGVRDTS